MTRSLGLAAAVLATSIALTACGSPRVSSSFVPLPSHSSATTTAAHGLHGRFRIFCVGTGAGQSPAPQPSPASRDASITFGSGSHVSGNDGVNDWTGTYTTSGDVLRVHMVGATAVGVTSVSPAYQAFIDLESGQPVTFMWSDGSPSVSPALTLEVGHFIMTTAGQC